MQRQIQTTSIIEEPLAAVVPILTRTCARMTNTRTRKLVITTAAE